MGGLTLLWCMVVPVVWIGSWLDEAPSGGTQVAGGVTAALGVLFRSTARNLLRSGVGTVVRAASRTASRRAAKRALRYGAAFLVRGDREAEVRLSPGISALLGLLATALSVAGVLWLQPGTRFPEAWGAVTPAQFVLAATAPLALHFVATHLWARPLSVDVRAHTGLDGLLLQAYFTGAGSFLPLASEVILEGPERAKAWVSGATLLTLVGGALALPWLGDLTGLGVLHATGVCCSLYAFVYAFPLRPLDGARLWAVSRIGWAVVWAGATATFAARVPEALYGLL